jgi:hypothetical protein
MSEPEIGDEMLAALLRKRGYEVTKRDEPSLAEKVDDVAAKLDEIREAPHSPEEEQEQAQPPRDPERAFAEGLRDAINQSRSRWYSLGGTGAGDGPQAA